MTPILASYADPRSGLAGPELRLAFTRLYHSYRNEDPALQPQLALTVSVFQNIVEPIDQPTSQIKGDIMGWDGFAM
jgi:hypothetical protein